MKTESIAEKRRAAIDALLDHALEETFPASDPPAVMVDIVLHPDEPKVRKPGHH